MDTYLEIENVVHVENEFEKILDGMEKILKSSIEFWKYLANKEVDLNRIRMLAKTMNDCVEETTALWGPIKSYLNK